LADRRDAHTASALQFFARAHSQSPEFPKTADTKNYPHPALLTVFGQQITEADVVALLEKLFEQTAIRRRQ